MTIKKYTIYSLIVAVCAFPINSYANNNLLSKKMEVDDGFLTFYYEYPINHESDPLGKVQRKSSAAHSICTNIRIIIGNYFEGVSFVAIDDQGKRRSTFSVPFAGCFSDPNPSSHPRSLSHP